MFRVIPQLEIREGKCRRPGHSTALPFFRDDPVDFALRVRDSGLGRLCLVDLDGREAGRIINFRLLERLATRLDLQFEVLGGVESLADLRIAWECGQKLANVSYSSRLARNSDEFASARTSFPALALQIHCLESEALSEAGDLKVHNLEFFGNLLPLNSKQCDAICVAGLVPQQTAHRDLVESLRERFGDIEVSLEADPAGLLEIEKFSEFGRLKALYLGECLMQERLTLKQLAELSGV